MPDIRWNEPASFKRPEPTRAQFFSTENHIRFGIIFGVMILLRLIMPVENPYPWFGYLLIALMVGVVMGYLLPFGLLFCPSFVGITATGIGRNSFNITLLVIPAIEMTTWEWANIPCGSLESATVNGKTFRVLVLGDPSAGQVEKIALSPKVPEADIAARFAEKGKKLTRR
jgi:hypothetical protein